MWLEAAACTLCDRYSRLQARAAPIEVYRACAQAVAFQFCTFRSWSIMRVLRVPSVRAVSVPRASSTVCRVTKLDMSEVRALSNDDIDAKVTELKTELLFIRMAQAAREKFKGAEMPAKRRDIARCLTVKREREIAEGISKRDSRKIEKKRLMDAGLG